LELALVESSYALGRGFFMTKSLRESQVQSEASLKAARKLPELLSQPIAIPH
jgi:hypothetical protein